MEGLYHWDEEVGSTQRHWRQHRPPIDEGWDHGWAESQHEPTLYDLPYRARSRDIQWPDGGHALQRSASHRHWPSEDMRTRESSPSRPLGRSATLSHRSSTKDPPARARREQYSRRARPATRSRSTSTSRSSSATSDSSRTSEAETEDSGVVTPTSAHEDRVTPESDYSSTASSHSADSSTDSSDDSAPPPSARRGNKGRADGKLKESLQVAMVPQPKSHHRHDRRRSQKEPAMLEAESEPAREPEKVARRRHKHHSTAKKSSSHAHHHYRDTRRDIRPASSSKRTVKKYYESGPSHSDKESLARSQTTQSTRSRASSKRSSTLVGRTVPSHTSRASHRSAKSSAFVECIACRNDETPRKKTVKLSCGHRMCRSCLKRVFRLSTKDPQHMPPKCCTDLPIDLKHVDALFDEDFKRTWNHKLAEFSASNRIYCPRKGCAEWIAPHRVQRLKDGRKKATCGRCRTEYCVACKGDWHESEDCPNDETSLQLRHVEPKTVRKRCSHCKLIVSIEEDCNRMPCCDAPFCMVCGAKWKTCDCPWFDYEELEEEEVEHARMSQEPSSGGRKERASRSSRAHSHRSRPPTYAQERSRRRRQEKEDERLARKMQYGHDDEDDDDYTGHYGEIVALGNTAGHHMNESYRRPQQAHMAPPMAPLAHPVPFERAATADYVAGVNKARGLRADPMEARLAERFSESRQGQHVSRRAFTHPIPPMQASHMAHMAPMGPMPLMSPMSPMSVGPLPPGPPSMPMMRRRTTEGDDYSTQSLRLTERMKPRHARFNQSFDPGHYASSSMGRLQQDNQSSSKLAGLTGIGRGAHRVDEWREFVQPMAPPPPETVG